MCHSLERLKIKGGLMGKNLIVNAVLAYISQGYCYLWNSDLVSLHTVSDVLIAIAYFSISCTLGYFVSKHKDLPHSEIYVLFGLFMFFCGVIHILEIWTLWYPTYWLSATAKVLATSVSTFTAVGLFFIVRQDSVLTSPSELEACNQALNLKSLESKQIESCLQESEERFRNSFDFAAIGMALVDLEGRWFKVNSALCDLVGYSEAELRETNFQAITYPGDLELDLSYVQQMLAGDIRIYEMEKRYIHKQGHLVWVQLNVSLVRDPQDNSLYFISQIQDISERKQLENQLHQVNADLEQRVQERTCDLNMVNHSLQQNQEQLELSLKASGDGWWHLNIQTDELDWSQQWYCMLGYAEQDLQPSYQTWESLVHPEDLFQLRDSFNSHSVDSTDTYTYDYRMLTKTGEWKWISNLGKVIERDHTGQPIRLAGMHHDISNRKQAEQQLQILNTELLRSNEDLKLFAYVASHDLQEPLRKIRNFSDLLSERFQDGLDETGDRYIRYITDGATRMQGLIDDLLSYSRVGQTKLNLQSTNLEDIVQQIKSDLETVIQSKNAVIIAETLPTLSVDPIQMQQLLQNLISNAIKYCQDDIPTVRVWATQVNKMWTISVQDNGIGIDMQFMDRIFVIFQRLHNRSLYSGTGIGLAICKKIVERHKGQIWVDSQEGKGSTFSFTLPIT